MRNSNPDRSLFPPHRVVLSLIITIHCILVLGIIRCNFVTVDEIGHVPSGITHWRTGRFDAYRVNPPLARMISALPALILRPTLGHTRLNTTADILRPEWPIGFDFINDNQSRYYDIVRTARLPGLIWSLLGIIVIFKWSSELYGTWCGILGVALWSFDPTILGFTSLVTPDIPASVSGLFATYLFYRYLNKPSWSLACACGIMLGVSQLSKYTLILLYAVWPVVWIFHIITDRSRKDRPSSWMVCTGHSVVILVLSLTMINLGYGFRGTLRYLGDLPFVSRTFGGESFSELSEFQNRFQGTWLGRISIPLPEDYIKGIDIQKLDFESRFPSYLEGRWRRYGWWYYYFLALAVKVPLGFWCLIVWGIIWPLIGKQSCFRLLNELIVWLPAIVFLDFVSSQTGINHHMRYVLPAFPFVIVATSKLGYFLNIGRWKSGLCLIVLLSWGVVSSLMIYPHSQSYFNEIAGGPENGGAHLVDSNIDWGQDLLFLKSWIDRHPETKPIGLAYYNLVDPSIIGIEYTVPSPFPRELYHEGSGRYDHLGPKPGYYAVSVNYLRGSSSFAPPDHKSQWIPLGGIEPYSYFQFFRPIARAGYSIYIYHITLDEANAARRKMGLPLLTRGDAKGSGADIPEGSARDP